MALLRTNFVWLLSSLNRSLLSVSVLLIGLAICDELQTEKQSSTVKTGKGNNGDGGENPSQTEKKHVVCEAAKDVSIHSVYVASHFVEFFIRSFDGSKAWNAEPTTPAWKATVRDFERFKRVQRTNFMPNGYIEDLPWLKDHPPFKDVSASFLHFSDSLMEKGFLVSGLSAYEYEVVKLDKYHQPTGNVKSITLCHFGLLTDLFKEADQKLLMPADILEEVVSVVLIKRVETDKVKDHALYKIIFKTVTKKLVKAYFKLTSKGEFRILNSEPFVPSAEVIPDEDEFNLLEESVLYNYYKLGGKDSLSRGYQFTPRLTFPIYFDYNPEANTYKEYPMRTKEGFNSDLETLADHIPYWNRYIVPTETWLGCPDQTFCLGRPFDAIFFTENKYYAVLDEVVYTFGRSTDRPDNGVPLTSLFPFVPDGVDHVDAAFTFGDRVFFIRDDNVYYKKSSEEPIGDSPMIFEIFPKTTIYMFSGFRVSALITLNRVKDASEVSQNEHPPSKLESAKMRKDFKIHDRAADTTKEDINTEMVYVYFTDKNGGNVNEYELRTKMPLTFKLVANKTYNAVNEALPVSVSMVFTAEDKVVTMVHHFMIEQSSQTFFTQTESHAKFTLVNNYFGCHSETVENKLTKEFVQSYLEFAGPKPGVDVFTEPTTKQESTESTFEGHGTDVSDSSLSRSEETDLNSKTTEKKFGSPSVNEDMRQDEVKSSYSAQAFSTSFIIQALLIIILVQILCVI